MSALPVIGHPDLDADPEVGELQDVARIHGEALVDGIDVAAVQRFGTLAELERCLSTDGLAYGHRRSRTVGAVESELARLETQGRFPATARLTSSGSTAQLAVTAALITREHSRVVLVRPSYDGTEKIFRSGFPALVLDTVDIDPASPGSLLADIDELVDQDTAMVWVEAITNPSLQTPDIAAISEIAARSGTPCVVDATLATPFVCTPLLDGATAVVHSLTKGLNGHGDVCAGVVALGDSSPHRRRVLEMADLIGGGVSPTSAWLLQRSLSTASLRVERAAENARSLALWLHGRPGLDITYPAIGGTLITLGLVGGRTAAASFIDTLTTIPLVPSFGYVTTTVSYPHLGHADICVSPGCNAGLVRISLGIENISDITADVARALENVEALPRSAVARRDRSTSAAALTGCNRQGLRQ